GPTQAQAPPSSQSQATAVHPDPKRAQKAAERGDKAAAAGRFEEALAAYEEAARYAPQDAAIIERSAALRSKLVRAYVEAAERDALAGLLTEAPEVLGAALRIDLGTTIVEERLGQLTAMEDSPNAQSTATLSGLPRLRAQPVKRILNQRGGSETCTDEPRPRR